MRCDAACFTREQLPSLLATARQRLRQGGPPTASGNRSDPRGVASHQAARQYIAQLLGTATPRRRRLRTKHAAGSGKRGDCHRLTEFGSLAREAIERSTVRTNKRADGPTPCPIAQASRTLSVRMRHDPCATRDSTVPGRLDAASFAILYSPARRCGYDLPAAKPIAR